LVISTQKEAAKASSSLPVAASNISHDHKGIISGLDLSLTITTYVIMQLLKGIIVFKSLFVKQVKEQKETFLQYRCTSFGGIFPAKNFLLYSL